MSYSPPPPGGYGYPGATPPPPPGFAAIPPLGNPNVYEPATFSVGTDCARAQQALLFAIVSLPLYGFVLGPVAIIMSLSAKRIIAMNPGMRGEGKATAALVIGAVAFVTHIAFTSALVVLG